MKVLGFIAALAVIGTAANGQVKSYKITGGTAVEGTTVAYSLPRTAIKVRLVVERSQVLAGPYARYAQKYLGVATAPLTDKDNYRIIGSSLAYFEEADPSAVYALDGTDRTAVKLYGFSSETAKLAGVDGVTIAVDRFKSDDPNEIIFKDLGILPIFGEQEIQTITKSVNEAGEEVDLPVTKTEVIDKSMEDMAADASEAIFTLRKRRFDLVTGDLGENVFGAGLPAALAEMERIEKEYVALFLGKHITQTIVRELEVIPDGDKSTVMVCRFSDSKGVLPDADLSGRPIVLEMTPEKKAQNLAIPRKSTAKGSIAYRVPDVVVARLMDGKEELLKERIPVYQFGSTVEVPTTF